MNGRAVVPDAHDAQGGADEELVRIIGRIEEGGGLGGSFAFDRVFLADVRAGRERGDVRGAQGVGRVRRVDPISVPCQSGGEWEDAVQVPGERASGLIREIVEQRGVHGCSISLPSPVVRSVAVVDKPEGVVTPFAAPLGGGAQHQREVVEEEPVCRARGTLSIVVGRGRVHLQGRRQGDLGPRVQAQPTRIQSDASRVRTDRPECTSQRPAACRASRQLESEAQGIILTLGLHFMGRQDQQQKGKEAPHAVSAGVHPWKAGSRHHPWRAWSHRSFVPGKVGPTEHRPAARDWWKAWTGTRNSVPSKAGRSS